MEYTIKFWKENTDYQSLKRKIGDRKVAIWGAYVNGKHVREILNQNGIEVSFYIDGHKNSCEYDNLLIKKPNNHENDEKIYIFVSVIGVREEIVQYLDMWNMKESDDYTYISKAMPRMLISECAGGYADCYGNRLEFEDESIQCQIEFRGFNNRIKIGRGFSAIGAKVSVENGSKVVIGDYVNLSKDVFVEAKADGIIEIGDSCLCYKNSKISSNGGRVKIGSYTTMGERFFCTNASKYSLRIGNDCMFSHDVSVILAGHSIFKLETKENTCMSGEKHINIGDHVWLGKNAVVLEKTEIGRGSIVGASSVVKIKTEENCIIAGNPARIIKTNHTWDRRDNLDFESI